MGRPATDLTGKRFGHLTVLTRSEIPAKGHSANWICRCDCGTEKHIQATHLKQGSTISCGCIGTTQRITHGMSSSRVYRIWQGMKDRCYTTTDAVYHRYGGRGITVCNAWIDSFEAFHADMGDPPDDTSTIERRENDGNYTPSNCHWASPLEQANNRRSNVFIEFNGKRQTIAQWSREYGIAPQTIGKRLRKKLPLEKVFQHV